MNEKSNSHEHSTVHAMNSAHMDSQSQIHTNTNGNIAPTPKIRSVTNIGQDDPTLVVPSESEIQTINTALNEHGQLYHPGLSNGLSKAQSNMQPREMGSSERSNPGLSKRSENENCQNHGLKHCNNCNLDGEQ